ncbi:hypothetical protein A5893_01595 [Pedobacter psychrophilus]|uniref:Stage II sporulation protein M n=1 Tax=Pedobacter psychrophilus TaxID=1826909 RepID=A0A179DL65_9SPHI|nr:stage II sporulation protein M [Pedobacter psychrophilus]OAQ41837.1 hypothetical protein A5893_01595 [Pedobacter psychrophilus]
MKEALFVKRNAQKWKDFEQKQPQNTDELAEKYIELTDDLAYSKTFYPNSSTTKYLNGITSGFHQSIYKNKKESKSRIVTFWKTELPLLFYQYRKQLLYSFLFFIVAVVIGAASAKFDDNFVRLVMGDGYINMTNENIAKGDPFAVYKQAGEMEMFVQIALNNIRVAFYTFIAGIIFSFGTVIVLFRNGIMLGSFQYFFFSKGLGWASVLTIWLHGTLEISSIVIAGAAGLILGNSILFPGTLPRKTSILMGSKNSIKIAIGLVPLFLIAAFIEGFITRHTAMPIYLSLSVLIISALFIIWYTIIQPKKIYFKANNGTTKN